MGGNGLLMKMFANVQKKYWQKDNFSRKSEREKILTLYLDGYDKVAAIFEEILCIKSDDTSLIWLSHIYMEEE